MKKEVEYPMVGHKWISIFIWYPIFVFEYIYENKEGEYCMKLVEKRFKRIIWNKNSLSINGIPIGLVVNIPFIIYLLIK